MVARELNRAGIGTLLFDLLTEEESEDRRRVFDIPFLAERLFTTTRSVREELCRRNLDIPLGYFGASTGAAAALWAASFEKNPVDAIVSRGGRPDLAMSRLDQIDVPTLLIVGGADEEVLEMNQAALQHLSRGDLVVVPGATHLFEEGGALEEVARHAIRWFSAYFGPLRKVA